MIHEFFSNVFLSRFENETFLIKTRAVLFLYSNLTMVLLIIPAIIVFIFVAPERVGYALSAISPLVMATILSLVLLKNGRYYLAVDILVIVLALTIVGSFFSKLFLENAIVGYLTFVYYMEASIVFTSLFSSKRMIVIISLFFIIADIVYVFVSVNKNLVSAEQYGFGITAAINSCLALILVFGFSLLFKRLTEGAMKKSEREVKINQEHYSKIQSLLASITDSSERLALSSEDLSNVSTKFSDNFQNQAASAEQITATMEEVSAGIDSNAQNAQEQYSNLSDLIEQLKTLSEAINEMSGKVSNALNLTENISQSAKQGEVSLRAMNQSINTINETSTNVTNVLAIIKGISDQINLLALNAAIEAARAGEAGRGFAVVADEISKLAEQTAMSLKEIDDLIKVNVEEIDKGTSNIDSTVAILTEIISGVNSITNMIEDIAKFMNTQKSINIKVNEKSEDIQDRANEIKIATQEQKIAISEVAKSVQVVNEITQSNSLETENLLSQSNEVMNLADELKNKVLSSTD